MSFNLKENAKKSSFELTEAGIYQARCARIVEVGLQETDFGEKEQVIFSFTLPTEKITIDGEEKQKMISSPRIPLSSGKKAKIQEYGSALDEKAVLLEELLGKSCMVNLVHYDKKDGTEGQKVAGILKPMKGLNIEEIDCDSYYYSISKDSEENKKLYNSFPEWLQKLIDEGKENIKNRDKSMEIEEKTISNSSDTILKEDIPF